MRRLRVLLGVSLAAGAAVVACTLNPQPLPPSDFGSSNDGSDASADAGQFGVTPPATADAGGTGNDREGGASDAAPDADAGEGDAGDAGAGDAAPDADGG
jgi:hypothetical protein